MFLNLQARLLQTKREDTERRGIFRLCHYKIKKQTEGGGSNFTLASTVKVKVPRAVRGDIWW